MPRREKRREAARKHVNRGAWLQKVKSKRRVFEKEGASTCFSVIRDVGRREKMYLSNVVGEKGEIDFDEKSANRAEKGEKNT